MYVYRMNMSRKLIYGLVAALVLLVSRQYLGASENTNQLMIDSVVVGDNSLTPPIAGTVNLGPFPKDISFRFDFSDTNARADVRLRGKLEGFESEWHIGGGDMFLAIRFFNAAGNQTDQKSFPVLGESAGWDGSLNTSPLTHRRETIVVPQDAALAWVVISSAGPPSTLGIYVVANLVMTETSDSSPPQILLESPFDHPIPFDKDGMPYWQRDGTHMGMAKVVQIGEEPSIKAFAIEDEDPLAHAEWHNVKETSPRVHPGNRLVIEWNEMYSIGVSDLRSVLYPDLPAGNYSFHLVGVDLMGRPNGMDTSLRIFVPQPFWYRPWFWGASMLFITVILSGITRYAVWHRLQNELLFLRSQRALESERLRIARDIHDDLGARVTQISMISALSLLHSDLPDKTREELNQIKQMSRELISALYETVWTVNPEYDDLDALGNYLCQMVNQICSQTHIRCRLQVADLPKSIQVSSQIRHNIAMVVKESVNNVVKHTQGSEIMLRLVFESAMLKITIQDDGQGFQLSDFRPGNGLNNMRQRMRDIGGSFLIESEPEHGTTVQLSLLISRPLAPTPVEGAGH